MTTWLKQIFGCLAMLGMLANGLADVALPGDGGGTETGTPGPPQSAPDAPGSLTAPQAGDLTTGLGSDLSLAGANVDITRLQSAAGVVDTVAGAYQPGRNPGTGLRTQLENLRQEALLIESQVGSNPDALAAAFAYRQKIENAQLLVRQLDAAVENSNTNLGVAVSRDAVTLLARRFGRSSRGSGATAGDLFSDWQFGLNYSYADFRDDEAGGDGDENEFAVSASANMGENFQVGFGLSQVRWTLDISGSTMERNTVTPEAYLNYVINDMFALGAFMSYAETDIETATITDPLLGTFTVGDQFGRWAGGLSASAHKQFGKQDFGLTTAITSANKSSLTKIFDVTDMAGMLMADMQSLWTDRFSTALYATYYTLIDREAAQGDGSFWFVGGDASYSFNDKIRVTLGYETTLGQAGYSENRINAGVVYTW